MKKYTVRHQGWDDYFIMKVYSNPVNMRHGITNDGGDSDANCVARVQPAARVYKSGFRGIFTSNMYATLYLNEKWMRVGILGHECLHVAMAHERFAYKLSDILDDVVKILRKGGHIR